MQTIYLDISNKGVVPTIYAKQGDVGRKFEVIFTNSGLPYVPPDGSVFSVWYSGQNGEGNYTDIGDNSAFSINENKVTVELIAQMLTNDGSGILCIVLNESNGNQIGSWNIPYLCEKVPGIESEAAKEYYTAFSKSVEGLKQVTENLTPEAIGARPNTWLPTIAEIGAAPDNIMELVKAFGINIDYIQNTMNSNFDTIDTNGIFKGLKASTVGFPDQMHEWAFVLNLKYDTDGQFGVQFAWDMSGNTTCQRYKRNGVWNPWECNSPPMYAGSEFRTTERYLEKVVYTKIIDCGAAADNKSIEISDNDVIRYAGKIGNLPMPFFTGAGYEGEHVAYLEMNYPYILIHETGFDNAQVYVQIWYTKV